jgi:hypothetical protein
MMISLSGDSGLPEIPLRGKGVSDLLRIHNQLIQRVTGFSVPDSSRAMFNFQKSIKSLRSSWRIYPS